MKRRILVVDDDEDILDLLKYNFEKEGYEVLTLNRSEKTVSIAKVFQPDLIILDIMMPEQNGIEVCRKLRTKRCFKNTYIFFLTAKSESYYQDAVFHTGGDDFIEKIIGLKALTTKVSVVLKKNYIISKSAKEIKIGNLKIKRATFSVLIDGYEILLSSQEFEILFFLVQNSGKRISKEHLVQGIWGSETFVMENNIDIYVQNLKRKLGSEIIHYHVPNLYQFNFEDQTIE
jgi:two-component system, OmpR family, alkaline phosphatase synthesis response regulator PhoP